MKRYLFLVAASLAIHVSSQTTYNNFLNLSEEGITVIPSVDITKITVDAEFPGCLDLHLANNEIKHLNSGDSGKAKYISISAEKLLAELYSYQYYGLPYNNNGIHSASPYVGKFDGLTDCYHIHWDGQSVVQDYYLGNLNSERQPLMSYTKDLVWQSVNKANELIKNLELLDPSIYPAKKEIAAEAKCIIAMHYFDMFMHYGGLPILEEIDTSDNYFMGDINQIDQYGQTYCQRINIGTDVKGIHIRRSVEETVDYMVRLLDEAIPHLKWNRDDKIMTLNVERIAITEQLILCIDSKRWTKAAAMALKAKILMFAASPLFNADRPYYDAIQSEQKPLVWYGNYEHTRWIRALQACREFFDTLEINGHYGLKRADKKDHFAYREAYVRGYMELDSEEALMGTRVCDYIGTQGTHTWFHWAWKEINRLNYSPTEEYAEMFSWSDGMPFRWEADSLAGKVDGPKGKLFYEYEPIRGGVKKTASRDPRMYENLTCNGQLNFQGDIHELWRGGNDADFNVIDIDGNITERQASYCPTGYGARKYVLTREECWRNRNHWVSLSLSEMYLMYAEALAQTGETEKALQYVDVIRARVGLKPLASCYKAAYGVDLSSDKDLLIEEILRERACELGMSNNRFYDMVRYKRTDWMTRQLHGLAAIRIEKDASNNLVERNRPWIGDDKNSGIAEPSIFKYYRFELRTLPRVLWNKDHNSDEVRKWLLSPLPQSEIDRNLGLIQNPGW